MKTINRDNLPHLVDCLMITAQKYWYGFLSKVSAKWWGVQVGPGCSFIGLPHFRRLPKSRISIGNNCMFRSLHTSNPSGINRPCIISTLCENAQIIVGSNCGFSGTAIACSEKIVIGNNVRCSPNTWLIDTDGHWDDHRTGPNAPIVIGNNVWLGANVSVLKGVTIGENTVVAACSLVTKSLPPNVVAAGIPAKVIKQIQIEK